MINSGRQFYGFAAIVLGVQGLFLGKFGAMGLQASPSLPGVHELAYVGAALLVLAGAATLIPRTAAVGAWVLAAFFALWIPVVVLPNAVSHPMEWVSWENLAETIVKALGGVLAWVLVAGGAQARKDGIARISQLVFGLCLVVFGTSEFVYAKFTASLVPAWLPPSQITWAYITGVFQIAAGLAVLSGVRARLAAMLVTTMYLVFTLIVHLPRVIATPDKLGAWAENGTNLVLMGAAWCLADSLAKARVKG